MSSRIWICPSCHQLGQHVDLPEDAVQAVLLEFVGPVQLPEATQLRVAWCPRCEAPYVVLYQEDVPRDERLRMIGYATDLIATLKGEQPS